VDTAEEEENSVLLAVEEPEVAALEVEEDAPVEVEELEADSVTLNWLDWVRMPVLCSEVDSRLIW
jgi:hypothetical protein